uniref:p18 protein n=1 Tax=Nicotiana alata TaxID=4087 RepID=O65849_NICAL|nr:P18 protein [Nicotiana alata]
MASLHKLSVLVTLMSSFILFISVQVQSNDLIMTACSGTTSKQLCLHHLKADKRVTAAASKELDLGLAIIKNLIGQAKMTHDYVLKKKLANPAYGFCETKWADMVSGFERVLERTTKNKGYQEDTDDYDFMVIGDYVGNCKMSLEEAKIVDPEIAKGGDIVGTSIAAANTILSQLKAKNRNKDE